MAAATAQKDHWSTEEYQSAASFVPKLAGKVVGWLDLQKDDVVLDLGCGDGVIALDMAPILASGTGSLHGIDSSPAMVAAAEKAVAEAGFKNCTFEAYDAAKIVGKPELQQGRFTKAFSNAAMHWILRPESSRETFFRGVRDALKPGGVFAFEMGGLGCVSEMKAGIIAAVGRRIGGGVKKAAEASPWFFPDEDWIRAAMREEDGWRIEKLETQWRPTKAGGTGVDGWVRLFAKQFFEVIEDEGEREEAIREAVELLEIICATPDGGYMFSYVRVRCLATRV